MRTLVWETKESTREICFKVNFEISVRFFLELYLIKSCKYF